MNKLTLSRVQIEDLFDEIAAAADLADKFVYHTPVPLEDIEQAETIIDALRANIRRIGWLADRGAAGVGGSTLREDADAWLVSPSWKKSTGG